MNEAAVKIISRRTGRSELLKVLAEFPEGLPVKVLLKKVTTAYAINEHNLTTILCQLVKGKILTNSRRACKCCERVSTIYKIKD